MIIKSTFYFLLSTFYFLLSVTNANEFIVPCNNCSANTSEQRIKNYAPNDAGTYIFHSTDVQNNSTRSYSVDVYDSGLMSQSGEPLMAKQLTPTNSPAGLINVVKDISNVASRKINIPTSTGLNDASNVYDMNNAGQILDNYLHDNHGATYWGYGLLSSYGSLLIGPLEGLKIRVCFDTKSCLDLEAPKFSDTSFTWKVVLGSAINADGNLIPQSVSDIVDETFQFSDSQNGGSAFGAFLNRLGPWGFDHSYQGGGSGCPGSFTKTTTCSNAHGEKRCTTTCT
jgi:hypothetical protein